MIVKIQASLATSEGAQQCLIYNKDRSVQHEGDLSPGLAEALAGRPKAYFMAWATPTGLEIGNEVEAQSW